MLKMRTDYLDTIIHGDCLEVVAGMPDECVDLVFADPPFNVGKAYQDSRDNYQEWCAEWIGECFRLLKPTGSFYLMTIPKHLSHTMRAMDDHGIFIDQVIWKNTSLNATPKQFPRAYQPILQYGKTDQYLFHPKAQVIFRDHTVQASQLKNKPELATGYPGRVTNFWDDITFIAGGCMAPREAVLCKDSKKKAHPCQMPIALPQRAIVFSTDEDGVVLDPFIGSGTTATACIRSKRYYVGIELEQKYVDIANERIRQERSQLELDLSISQEAAG